MQRYNFCRISLWYQYVVYDGIEPCRVCLVQMSSCNQHNAFAMFHGSKRVRFEIASSADLDPEGAPSRHCDSPNREPAVQVELQQQNFTTYCYRFAYEQTYTPLYKCYPDIAQQTSLFPLKCQRLTGRDTRHWGSSIISSWKAPRM